MGYVSPPPPGIAFRPNLDKDGLPLDYETYIWATYGAGKDLPPDRRAFLYPSRDSRTLPAPDLSLIGVTWR